MGTLLKRSLKVIQTGNIRKLGCGFLFAFRRNIAIPFGVGKLEWWDYPTV